MTELVTTRLEELEAIIAKGLQTFVDVGNALAEIREAKLYKEKGFSTWDEYCQVKWGIKKRYANDQISSARVVNNLLDNKVGARAPTLPETEYHARPLRTLSPENQVKAWKEVVENNPPEKITYDIVKSVAQKYPAANPKPKVNRNGNTDVSSPYDRCQTPDYALEPLWDLLDPSMVIWEPANGEGNITKELENRGFTVVTSDILTGQNFFEYEPDNWDVLVTNPPYSIKYDWLKRCYELGKPFALLMPLETLGAKSGQQHFATQGIELILFDKRINFKMPNKGWENSSAQFPTAWFTYKLTDDCLNFWSFSGEW